MVSDISSLKSHPEKLLIDHIKGVRANVNQLTKSAVADLVAVFHDVGKCNPFFQQKLEEIRSKGYSNHSYLSAFAFFCSILSQRNKDFLTTFINPEHPLNVNDFVAIAVLIAKHHTDLPNFTLNGSEATLLSKDEIQNLFDFLGDKEDQDNRGKLLLSELIVNFYPSIEPFQTCLYSPKARLYFKEKLGFSDKTNEYPLDFFLDYQFAFSALLLADKVDAANFSDFISQQKKECGHFAEMYPQLLEDYLSSLSQEREINRLRTSIRREAVQTLHEKLTSEKRVFELTAPTGSGKTLMMLSLASEFMQQKGPKRIIYALPFLSITEQVEAEVVKIFEGCEVYIQRIDSKSENKDFNRSQQEWEHNPTKELLDKINLIDFKENTFSYPFIITTFVRFFETLLSNRNADLLKLPNFANSIFLLDEIQALPPRLYGFFVAYLTKFCEKFDSYAIISTATQPNFELPKELKMPDKKKEFFSGYTAPAPLLEPKHFENPLFDRYHIQKASEPWETERLREEILNEKDSCLVILNTIDDTKELYKQLLEDIPSEELLLLNTHITPADRCLKIDCAKERLRDKKRIIVVSTQLIEAGVDIDFPILYRDATTVASLVQSAGRCNRNGKMPTKGKVVLFELTRNKCKRAELIYRGRDRELLRFTKEALEGGDSWEEKDLFEVQKRFFDKLQRELYFAKHWSPKNKDNSNPDFDFIEDIRQCMYRKIGGFRLIDEKSFGEEHQYFVPQNDQDDQFERLLEEEDKLTSLLGGDTTNWEDIRRQKRKIASLLKKMASQIVQIRIYPGNPQPLLGNSRSYFSLYKLDRGCYSFERGIRLDNEGFIL
ncbi:CRISPR-associated helicase/endonuclease Cas3 [Porphyromonas gingivicanis]|uniref:CRISPR-associated helicase/endonuclease Cas3 n=1 Tax=Porphyromonas gingivicanis TaxID=266762 RepID=UPI000470EF8D|nr:CRISPR-associated helicase/endonuclease Cas3 [Porphyromonas gingivicanis]